MKAEDKEAFDKMWDEKIKGNEWTSLERMACKMGWEEATKRAEQRVKERLKWAYEEGVSDGESGGYNPEEIFNKYLNQKKADRYCNDCGDYIGDGCDNSDCKDFKQKKG